MIYRFSNFVFRITDGIKFDLLLGAFALSLICIDFSTWPVPLVLFPPKVLIFSFFSNKEGVDGMCSICLGWPWKSQHVRRLVSSWCCYVLQTL